jgi:hypothetical protein
MPWLITVLVLGAAAGVMVLLSHPEELRPGRIWKMAVSLPMLAIGLSIMAANAGNPAAAFGQVTFYVFFIGIPILIWTPTMTWHAARFLSTILHGSGRAGGGFRPEYGLVRFHMKEGDLDEALKLLDEELDKDRNNFEGLLLLAQIHLYKKQPQKAIAALQTIIAAPNTTDEQRTLAVSEKKRLECEFAKPADGDDAPPPVPRS